jgi:hypothetical protein
MGGVCACLRARTLCVCSLYLTRACVPCACVPCGQLHAVGRPLALREQGEASQLPHLPLRDHLGHLLLVLLSGVLHHRAVLPL